MNKKVKFIYYLLQILFFILFIMGIILDNIWIRITLFIIIVLIVFIEYKIKNKYNIHIFKNKY